MPEMFESLNHGVTGRALSRQQVKLDCWNLRDWGVTQHGHVDDRPYGGGPGMVMMYEPLSLAVKHAQTQMPTSHKVVYLSPQGRKKKQAELLKIAQSEQAILFIAGRYEGIDERILSRYVDEEWSLGDFVLSGGELAAMVYIDAITRLVPGTLGHEASAFQDSFSENLLDHPHYTRPEMIDGMAVPHVLLSGNHQSIATWRRKQSLGATWLKRPDLFENIELCEADLKLLEEFKVEQGGQSD